MQNVSSPIRELLQCAVVALALVVSGCSASGGGDGLTSGTGRITQVPRDEREEPLTLSGVTLDGAQLDIADLRGEPVVLNVWWSLCGPCIKEMPLLNEVAESGIASFVGINIREASIANAQSFERERDVSYPSLFDPGSELLLRFGRYTPVALPTTVVLDAEGRVAAIIPGALTSARTLIGLIEDADA